ncbi:phosphatase PAP2 family protein [Polynucleobacter sp. AP-Latsch-80-C2]|jgi:membrane-associated phospholipid phosphatase|uniref:phosphatase PAP2 family protein n=1 Tax=Polynucleobacter sp. AP-Latsch-80-C2 TaxID=2576931 RepID=UPI001C0CC0AE|nr:phosphatase PAP2 family protein [Polynucleobacter sp. AP-Latsch-80-C2]MBU3623563.1 phosphatase PAP2 family protein [Polynucleobacter sp. AP-Latsch-80-C2]
MSKKAIPTLAWLIPLLPIALATAIYFGEFQSSSFLFVNRFTQILPDTLWAWLTFFGNGWGVFAIAFPLLLLAPRLLTAGILTGVIAALASTFLKSWFDLPRPAGLLEDGSFYRIGEPLLNRAFPSGHSITAFAIASALYFSVDNSKRRPMLLIFVFAVLIGLSRSAVGAHWLTDVLAGAGVGMWCGMIGAILARYIPDDQLQPTKILPRLIAIAGALSIYVHLTQIIDLELNLPLQYAAIVVIILTLVFFIKAQFTKAK